MDRDFEFDVCLYLFELEVYGYNYNLKSRHGERERRQAEEVNQLLQGGKALETDGVPVGAVILCSLRRFHRQGQATGTENITFSSKLSDNLS